MSEYLSQQLPARSALQPLYNFTMCGKEQDNKARPNSVKEMRTLVRRYRAINKHRKVLNIFIEIMFLDKQN